MTLPETAALLEQQRQDYQTVVSASKAVADCIGVTIVDYTDRVSLPTTLSVCHVVEVDDTCFSTPGSRATFLHKEPLTPGVNLLVLSFIELGQKKPTYDNIVAGFTA